jgi:hypothetical protein
MRDIRIFDESVDFIFIDFGDEIHQRLREGAFQPFRFGVHFLCLDVVEDGNDF